MTIVDDVDESRAACVRHANKNKKGASKQRLSKMENAQQDLRSTFDSILNRGNEPTYSNASSTHKQLTPTNSATNVFKRISPVGWAVVIATIAILVFMCMKRTPTRQSSPHDVPNGSEQQYDAEDPLFQPFDD